MATLANKYRPQDFVDVTGQEVNIKILTKQINDNTYSHSILFAGPAGCGKTTCAKILANKIDGEVIELDCASHNGVADVKEIIEIAKNKPILHNYKVFILDECHTLSPQAWSSMLITLEENLPYAIFIFCTTDTQKIPDTIISRLQRFNFLPITEKDMLARLKVICNKENLNVSEESLSYIVSVSKGNLRQALTNLDKCVMYDDFSVESVCKVLNIVSKHVLVDLYNAYENKSTSDIINIIESLYNNGYELHQFVTQFLNYCLNQNDFKLVERILQLIRDIRYDDNPKNIIIASLII